MSMADIITLDVGGETFRTARSTLVSCPDSLLAKMFDLNSDRPPTAVTKEGSYFLDVNPKAFGIILDWLRLGELMVTKGEEMERVGKVADYLGLNELRQVIEKKELEEVAAPTEKEMGLAICLLNDFKPQTQSFEETFEDFEKYLELGIEGKMRYWEEKDEEYLKAVNVNDHLERLLLMGNSLKKVGERSLLDNLTVGNAIWSMFLVDSGDCSPQLRSHVLRFLQENSDAILNTEDWTFQGNKMSKSLARKDPTYKDAYEAYTNLSAFIKENYEE